MPYSGKNYIRLIICTLAYLHICTFIFSQVYKYPLHYFRNPLDIPMELAANFGELRPNHWHMGLDIRTNQREGLSVYAAAEGYIAYIGVRPQSFGRFIIINHPNGYSTLYAHLNNFNTEVQQYVWDKQHELESWAVELEIPEEKFPVRKGQFIAYSGNTGGSQGPHLHFEIRETKTGKSVNPLLFGFALKDNVAPVISKLAMYDRSVGTYYQTPKFFPLKKTDSGYIIPKFPVVKTGFNKVSFAIQAIDRSTGSQNPNGIYTARIFLDDERISEFILDKIDYRESEFINAQIDYRLFKSGKGYLQHISPLPGDSGPVYNVYNEDGTIILNDTLKHSITIQAGDVDGNFSTLRFNIRYEDSLSVNRSKNLTSSDFLPNYVSVFEKPDFEVYLPEGCIYDTIQPLYYKTDAVSTNSVSDQHQLNDNSFPVHDELSIRIRPTKEIRNEWADKIIIQRNGGNAVIKPQWQNNNSEKWLSFKTGSFGSFVALLDLAPPVLNELGKGDTINLSPASRILFSPTDISGIKKFRAELDSKWLMFTNDKGRDWVYHFDERCPYGIHHLKVTAEDLVGNITIREWWFKKYPYTPPRKKVDSKKKKTTPKRTVRKKK